MSERCISCGADLSGYCDDCKNRRVVCRPKIQVIMADALPRPIETASTDHPYSRRLLLFSGGEWEVGYWNKFRGVWSDTYDYELFPSHWLPVPPSPNDL